MQLALRALDGEILRPGATVRVIGRAHPLAGERLEQDLPAGLSVAEILANVAGDRYAGGFIVHLDGHPIAPENFRKVRVKAGVTLTFMPRLQNGGAIWKTVLTAVVAITALIVAPYLAPGLVTAFTAIGISVSVATATAIAAAGVMLAGGLALNALFPTRSPQLSSDSASSTGLNSIQGAQNTGDPFGPVPVVLGRHRQSPRLGAKQYTEIVGDDQYLRVLFCLGYGPLLIEDMRLGETPLSTYADVETEIRQGFPGDPPITLYPGEVDEVPLTITLDNTHTSWGNSGGAGDWYSQTSADDADEIALDFTAPQGMYQVNKSTGDLENTTVSIQVQYRKVGDVAFISGGDLLFSRATKPSRKGWRMAVARGQYEVQSRRVGGTNSTPENVVDTVQWTALRSIKHAPPIAFAKPLALVALRIRATDQLSGAISSFNCVTTSLVSAYTGSGSIWAADTASAWPPDLFRHVLQGPANARPRADAQIDIAGLQDWYTYCVAKGFKFNQVLTAVGSVYDKLADIASAGRAVVTFVNGKWGVAWDRPSDPIVQHFTPRNSWGFQGQRPYAQQPHGWRVTFINEDNGFTQDERIVYDDGYDSSNATLFEGLEFPGVTDPDLIWKHGRFHIAQSRLRPEKLSLSVGWEHLVATRGDRVRVTHDAMLIGLASARVKAISGQMVTLDEVVTVEAGKTYGITFRVVDATRSIERAVDPSTVAGDYTQLELVGDLSLVAVGDLCAFGETGQETSDYRIQGISHQKNLVATLTLVDDAPGVSLADSGAIPAYNPNVTIPADPYTLPPRDLRYVEVIDGQGATARAVVRLTWQVPRFGIIASFEVQQRDDNAAGAFVTVDSVAPPHTDTQLPLPAAGVWSYRVRCLFTNGTASTWSLLEHVTLAGLSRAPSPIANLRQTFINGRSFLSWDNPVDPRNVPIEVRKGQSFASAQIVEDAAVAPWQTVGDDTYWVSAYAVSPFGTRVYASPDQSIAITGSVAIENLVVGHDERAEGWLGTFTGAIGKDQDNNFLRTAGDDDFLGRADFLGTGNFLDGDGVPQGGGIYWSPTIVDTGGLNYCRVSNDWTATGVPADDDFLGNADFLGNLDFLKASLSQFVRVRPVIRIALAGGVPSWGTTQVWSPDVYYGWQFQLGIQFEILDPAANAIAYLLSWTWSIDVPDRFDSYLHLTVPVGGLPLTFRPSGAVTDIPFHGGPNDEALPHLTPSIRNPNAGDQVVWQSLTLAGVTLKVVNAGVDVGGSEVNLLVRGY
ncbi:hypothetical protein PMI42_00699 [Bradyrhizobium sp. YR681]|uniref:host specificity factor TipJ family phage tail protein n=1 Tax=Bradyrhizobium sp. YR681 TaxID=1144344 RepID=UPI000270DED3|nr:host specificity factor TipJ family phage tail protein [Bradyrhizobium sp. YR681]EJN15682.1 hypothetical protein PMI42_00699 [Bradyrhizobium sp. YR681]